MTVSKHLDFEMRMLQAWPVREARQALLGWETRAGSHVAAWSRLWFVRFVQGTLDFEQDKTAGNNKLKYFKPQC